MKTIFAALSILWLIAGPIARAANPETLTVAIFDFESKDEGLRDAGPKVTALINANLSATPQIITVERAELEKVLGEQELGLSGTVAPETAAKVGHLTGAKILVTGRVFKVDNDLFLVAKIIGTETSRVYGEVVKTPRTAALGDMATELAGKIAKVIADKGDTLVARIRTREDRIEQIKKALPQGKLPVVQVKIAEQHFGARVIDPAAETELVQILQKCGFSVVDSQSDQKPEVEITGEGFSELGMRKGNLVSCKARVELKVRRCRTGEIMVIDRQTSVAADLSEHIAGKSALQQAAQELAERVLPSLIAR